MVKHVIPVFLLIGLSYSQGGSYALDFDGSDDYVSITDDASLTSTSVITISAWFKKVSGSGWMSLVGKGTSDANEEYVLLLKDDQVYFDVGNGGGPYLQQSTTIAPETWHHIAAVHTRSSGTSTLKVYLNGQDVGGTTVNASNTPNDNSIPLTIGSRFSTSNALFEGRIDDVRIWNDARTVAEIQEYMHKEVASDASGLVAYYKMSDGSGTSLADNSSNSNTGTLTNMVTSGGSSDWVTSYAPIGDLNSSYETDVEAIWKVSGTSASDASDGLTMTVGSALSTGNFAVFGNNNTSGTSASDIGSVGSTDRTGRIWQVDESGTVAGTITIDISDATGNAGHSGTASNFRLLYRSGTSGDFSSAATGASISGDVVTFTSVSLADGYYALGAQSDASLPVELTSFEVLDTRDNGITLHWITESEINNLGFILDRRTPTIDWIEIASFVTDTELQGQGSVSHQTIYTYTDNTVIDNEVYDYRIADVDYDGNKEYHSLQLMGISPASIPSTYVLHQNYPNPFNPITTLSYDLPEDALVNITIYDMMGKVVRTLINMEQTAGYKSIQWNATNDEGKPVSAGLYLYTIQAGEFRQTKKMVLLK